MDVVILLVFISLLLVAAGLVFFIYRYREGDFEHGDRLALAPLNDGDAVRAAPSDQGRGTSRCTNRSNKKPEEG